MNAFHEHKYFKIQETTVKRIPLLTAVLILSFGVILMRPLTALAAPIALSELPVLTANANNESITKGPDGNLWFAEASVNKIAKMTTAGTITEFTVPTSSSRPADIVTGPDGNLWFTELNGNKIGMVTTSGTFTEYTVPTSASSPLGIAKGPDGNLWFTEDATSKVASITTSGTITEYALPALSGPVYITSGPDGNLWVADNTSNKISKVTTTGTVTSYPLTTASANVNYIVAGPDGNLWFTENGVDKIGRITTSGTVSEFGLASGSAPNGITAGPDGYMWFTEYGSNKIGQMSTSGTVINQFSTISVSASPFAITTGPDGNLWFTEYTANNIGKITLPTKPVISNQSLSATTAKATVFNVLSSASNSPAASTLSIVSNPAHGTATVDTTAGTITYTSAANFTGSDPLTYSICSTDDNGICAQATLTFSVTNNTPGAPNTGFGVSTANPLRTLAVFGLIAAGIAVASLASRKVSNRK